MKDRKFQLLIVFFVTIIGPMMYVIDLYKVLGYITL